MAESNPHSGTVALTAITPFLRMVFEQAPEVVETGRLRVVEMLGHWGLSVAQIESNPNQRLPFALAAALNDLAIDLLDDPAASLKAATHLQPHDYELLEYLASSCNTVGDAIECMAQYYRLLIDAEYELHMEGNQAEVHFRFAESLNAPPELYEYALASNLMMAMFHLEWDGVSMPIESRYRHPAPPHADLFESIMASPVRFGCDSYVTVFPASLLRQPMKEADPVLHAVLRRQADRELAALPTLNVLIQQVRQLLDRDLAGDTSLDTVAGALAMSASTLRSKLKAHGTTFSDVLDGLRRDRARQLLGENAMSVTEVAGALGFSHAPALHRATQRWFGCSPTDFRSRQHRHPAVRLLRPV